MLKKLQQVSLRNYHTFRTDTKVHTLYEVYTDPVLINLIERLILKKENFLILGDGSNILFTKDFKDTIVKICVEGITIEKESDTHIWVKVAAGESWQNFIEWCLQKDYGGLQNLYLIPGCVGAAPIQNIGAYGVEQKDCFEQLKAYDITNQKITILKKEDCNFSYRNSTFKTKEKDRYIILSVTYKLTKSNHKLKLGYGIIRDKLKSKNIINPTISDVAMVIGEIRKSKLPDYEILGNAGSFFKNPELDKYSFRKIKIQFPDIKFFPSTSIGKMKISAAWLIEKAGWKGRRIGEAGVYEKHALILVNHGNASGKDIYNFSEKIKQDVLKKFSIHLEPEVNILPN